MIIIALTQGKYARISEEDYAKVAAHNWHYHAGYAWTNVAAPTRSGRSQLSMHRFLLDRPEEEVDHANRDGLDNRRENLRLCTRAQNCANTCNRANKISKFRGVTRRRRNGQLYGGWHSQIRHHKELIHIGDFATEEEAARAYDNLAKKLHGAYANLNFKDEHGISI